MFTIVDDGYDVTVFPTFKALWTYVENHLKNGVTLSLSLDECGAPSQPHEDRIPVTKASLKQAIKGYYHVVRIYQDDEQDDWYWKIEEHGFREKIRKAL